MSFRLLVRHFDQECDGYEVDGADEVDTVHELAETARKQLIGA
ncbi:MAG: hypothetical protein ABSH56_32915 [Bryobacteraceae bacterium]